MSETGPKSALRAQMLARLKAVPALEREILSRRLCRQWEKKAEELGLFSKISKNQNSEIKIGIYRSLASEVDLKTLEESLAKRGLILCFPQVSSDSKNAQMDFFTPASDWGQAPWTKSHMGMLEPDLSARLSPDGPPAWNLVPPQELKWIFVPGVAFSKRLERMGRGKGFYDRYLAQAPEARRFSLIYDFQWCESVPVDPWDLPMDWVFSESQAFRSERPF